MAEIVLGRLSPNQIAADRVRVDGVNCGSSSDGEDGEKRIGPD